MPIDKKFFDTKVEYPAQRDMFEKIISFLKKNKNMAYSAHELSLETKIRYTTIQSLMRRNYTRRRFLVKKHGVQFYYIWNEDSEKERNKEDKK